MSQLRCAAEHRLVRRLRPDQGPAIQVEGPAPRDPAALAARLPSGADGSAILHVDIEPIHRQGPADFRGRTCRAAEFAFLTVDRGRQREAIAAARETAMRQGSEMLIHGENGRIRERNTYGADPFPPKG